ncbi:MAG: VCBS repeat-containing protein [Planctomycetaceae bacterium]
MNDPSPTIPTTCFAIAAEWTTVQVTASAGVGDLSFSHGVCVGDFDLDGFPDIHLGNLGVNRLYRNNGDGTYEEVTRQRASLETNGLRAASSPTSAATGCLTCLRPQLHVDRGDRRA